MNEHDEQWEREINALFDGELDGEAMDRLKTKARADADLAGAIIEAQRLQQVMDTLHVERAPARLRRRLRAIPRQERGSRWPVLPGPRWAAALAAVPLIIIAVSLMQPDKPSAREVAKARHDLAVAFSYLDKAGQFTAREIRSEVGNTLTAAVAGTVLKDVKSQYQSAKETKA
jgi:hypothetical protein